MYVSGTEIYMIGKVYLIKEDDQRGIFRIIMYIDAGVHRYILLCL